MSVELLFVSDVGKLKPNCPGLPTMGKEGWVPGMGVIRMESAFTC